MNIRNIYPNNVFQLTSGLIVNEQQLNALMTRSQEISPNRINPCDIVTFGTNHAKNLLNNFSFDEIKKQAIELVDSLDGMNQVQHYVTLFKEQSGADDTAKKLQDSILSVTNEIELAFSSLNEMLNVYFNLMQLVSDLNKSSN